MSSGLRVWADFTKTADSPPTTVAVLLLMRGIITSSHYPSCGLSSPVKSGCDALRVPYSRFNYWFASRANCSCQVWAPWWIICLVEQGIKWRLLCLYGEINADKLFLYRYFSAPRSRSGRKYRYSGKQNWRGWVRTPWPQKWNFIVNVVGKLTHSEDMSK